MGKNYTKVYLTVLGLISVISLFIALKSSGNREEIEKLRKEVNLLREELTKKEEQLKKAVEEKEKLARKLKSIEEKIKKANKTLRRKGIKIKLPQGGLFIPADRKENLEFYASTLENSMEKLLKVMAEIPVGVPLYGRLTSRFGYRKDPFNGKLAFHAGIDLRAQPRQPVFATANGIVKFAGWSGGYGKLVIIKHKYGYETYYGHLFKIRVKKGQRVKAGTVIGYAGSTGRSTGVHLHYEIRRYGRLLNPLKYLYLNRYNAF
ncbi:MAG TPA: hypothetical protein DEP48_07230 [Persephonella sp.]|uniref:NlpD n=1 Tax=Persephonella marina (strain DSM 14350 / EX-H1) TaxID=123214 RepID=C0QU84_PERMH|nr:MULTISPECIES: M23 family metallopeptidase [Persephonella]ACO04524.1 NlpD fragment [Persephonella marina EX-H1]HCB70136.1 hypothetical protein [Persephonella sp.]